MIPREVMNDSYLYGGSFREHLGPLDKEKIQIYKLTRQKIRTDCGYWAAQLKSVRSYDQVQGAINFLRQVASSRK